MRSTESFRNGAEAGSRNCRGIRDCIVCKSDEELVADVAAEAPPKARDELPLGDRNLKK